MVNTQSSAKLQHVKQGYAYVLLLFCMLAIFPSHVLCADLDTWYRRSPPNALYEVAYGNSTFVTVGYNGTILTSSNGVTWTKRTTGATNHLRGVTYGNSTFVTVGYDGTILTSSNGVTWTERTSGTSNVLAVVTYVNSTFVAVGSKGIILTSSDGVAWTIRDWNLLIDLEYVTYGNGKFVAVGYNYIYNIILTSTDGVTWTRRAPGMLKGLAGVTYVNSTFVAVGAAGTILTSPDGVTWTTRTSGTSNNLHAITYGNSTFVTAGDLGTILTSSDGVTWTIRASGTRNGLNGITYGNSTFVTVGDDGTILTSSNGVTWTERTSGTGNKLFEVTYGNSTFVTVGEKGIILSSSDGVTWTERVSGSSRSSAFTGVTYGNSTFVAVGEMGRILASPDGVTWTIRNRGDQHNGVSYGNGTFVVVGNDGTILQSGSTATTPTPTPACKAVVSFLDEEDTTREVSGAAADGESQVVIQISNLCDDISENDIKITVPASDGTLGKKEFKDGVFTQIWEAPENFVREGQDADLETGKRKLDFQITVKGEEVAVPDFYLFKPPVVLVHGIWANAGSLKSMNDYLKKHYTEWVDSFTYPNSRHFADNVATVGGMISGTINAMKNQKIEGLEYPIVVKKADVIAHSMGGILTGLYIASNDYKNNINRLITIGTPHSGSELANFTLHFVYNEMTSEERTEFFNGSYYKIIAYPVDSGSHIFSRLMGFLVTAIPSKV